MSIFEGSAVALVTPFTETGVNFAALERLLDFQISNGTDAILVCGTTGEPSTMTEAEKQSVIEFAVKHVAGRIPVIAGTGSNDTRHAVELSKNAEKAGADALLVVTPYYNKCTQEGLFLHYSAIAGQVGLPIIIYNVPSRTGLNMLPSTLERLSHVAHIAGIKEASGNISQIAEMSRLTEDRLALYSGNDDQIVPLMALGGKGVISVLANIAPKQTAELCHAYLAGDTAKAGKMQLFYNPLIEALFWQVNPIPVKTALNLMGFDCGPLRLPLCAMGESAERALKETLQQYNLL